MADYEGHKVTIITNNGSKFTAYLDTLMDKIENDRGEGFLLDEVSPNNLDGFILLNDIKMIAKDD